jgi:hypothetical protein
MRKEAINSASRLGRLMTGAWLRTASWGLSTSLRTARSVLDPGTAARMAREANDGLRGLAREFLGVSDLDDRITELTPSSPPADLASRNGEISQDDLLRARGAELLRRSADVDLDEQGHPAYARILEELAPDEARILRMFAIRGPQPTVDVRATHLIGVGSQLVVGGLNMIGPEAGCRHIDRVPAYLDNLNRLGLIWFSREPLEDPAAYQVLEAQPDVLHALKRNTRSKTIQRSIHLTPFGMDFCEVCLPLAAEEVEALRNQRS